MVDTMGIYHHHFHNPQQNFPGNGTKQSPEAKFAERFAIAYRDRFARIHSGTSKWNTLLIREVPV